MREGIRWAAPLGPQDTQARWIHRRPIPAGLTNQDEVEVGGLEPPTYCVQSSRSPS